MSLKRRVCPSYHILHAAMKTSSSRFGISVFGTVYLDLMNSFTLFILITSYSYQMRLCNYQKAFFIPKIIEAFVNRPLTIHGTESPVYLIEKRSAKLDFNFWIHRFHCSFKLSRHVNLEHRFFLTIVGRKSADNIFSLQLLRDNRRR